MATLAELCIAAVAEAFRTTRELVGTGIGPIPRLGVGLAKLTHSPGLMMTDGEAFLVEQPVPIGPRGYDDRQISRATAHHQSRPRASAGIRAERTRLG